jgi:hypothetical protein
MVFRAYVRSDVHGATKPLTYLSAYDQTHYLYKGVSHELLDKRFKTLLKKHLAQIETSEDRQVLTDVALTFFILSRWAPYYYKTLGIAQAEKAVFNKLDGLKLASDDAGDDQFGNVQAEMDLWYMKKMKGLESRPLSKKKILRFLARANQANPLLGYIFQRSVQAVAPQWIVPKSRDDFMRAMRREPRLFQGYFLAHIVLYDSEMMGKSLDIKDYVFEHAQLREQLPYVIKEKKFDLGGEMLIAFRLLGQPLDQHAGYLLKLLLQDNHQDVIHTNSVDMVLFAKLLDDAFIDHRSA